METFDEAAYRAAAQVAELIISKMHDYGHGNILAFGEYGVLVRSSDKLERLKNLLKRGVEPENESVKDTWRDLCGYAMIALMLRDGTFALPLKKEEKDGN